MKQRSVPLVIILSLVTLGIYFIIWCVITRNEMKEKGIDMVHPLLILIPVAGAFIWIYFLWQYSAGVEKVTNGKYSQVVAFLLLLLINYIGIGLVQNAYNEIDESNGNYNDPFSFR